MWRWCHLDNPYFNVLSVLTLFLFHKLRECPHFAETIRVGLAYHTSKLDYLWNLDRPEFRDAQQKTANVQHRKISIHPPNRDAGTIVSEVHMLNHHSTRRQLCDLPWQHIWDVLMFKVYNITLRLQPYCRHSARQHIIRRLDTRLTMTSSTIANKGMCLL